MVTTSPNDATAQAQARRIRMAVGLPVLLCQHAGFFATLRQLPACLSYAVQFDRSATFQGKGGGSTGSPDINPLGAFRSTGRAWPWYASS